MSPNLFSLVAKDSSASLSNAGNNNNGENNNDHIEGGLNEDEEALLAARDEDDDDEEEEEEEEDSSDEEEEESLAEIEVDTDDDELVPNLDAIDTVSLVNNSDDGGDHHSDVVKPSVSRCSLPILPNPSESVGASASGTAGAGSTAKSSSEKLSSRSRLLFRSMRTQGRRILVEPFERLYEIYDPPEPSCDILSIVIHCQMWHLADKILGHLDAVSLKTCEEVRTYVPRPNFPRHFEVVFKSLRYLNEKFGKSVTERTFI